MHDDSRNATFSSSSAWKLFATGRGGSWPSKTTLTYIRQVSHEIKLGRSIKNQAEAKQTSWGTFLERRVFKLLDSSYKNVSGDGRLTHPDNKHWTGVPDFLRAFDAPLFNTVADCKCPFSPEKFCDKMEALQDYGTFKKEFPADFWQLVSNLVLLRENGLDIDYIEAVNYMPYRSELDEIRMSAEGDRTMRWLEYTTDEGLPWMPNGGHYKNLNVHRFRVMERDVEFCKEVMKKCTDMLLGIETTPVIAPVKRDKAMITITPSAPITPRKTGGVLNALKKLES